MRSAPPYSTFAAIYDSTMSQVPYHEWAREIVHIFRQHSISSQEIILDLACGTGELTRLLKPLYPYICGVDISTAMLQQARKKGITNLILADIRKLPLAQATVAAILCTHDSINYLLDRASLTQHFQTVAFVLKRGGIYLFDSSSERNVVRNYHGKEFYESHGNIQLHWKNHYDFASKIITSRLFFQNGEDIITEEHQQYIFTPREIKNCLAQSGLTLLEEFFDYRSRKGGARLHCYLVYK